MSKYPDGKNYLVSKTYVQAPVGKTTETLWEDLRRLGLDDKVVGEAARVFGQGGLAVRDGSIRATSELAKAGYRIVLALKEPPLEGTDGSIFYAYPTPSPNYQTQQFKREAKESCAV